MSLDLNKLANKIDEALSNETSETLTKFLNDKRMTNNKQQTEMNKEFVPYELALELKQLGFDKTCFGWFRNTEFTISFNDLYPKERGEEIKIIAAPTYSQAFRWFRYKYWYTALILCDSFEIVQQVSISKTMVDFKTGEYRPNYITSTLHKEVDLKSYDESELACLKKLIEIANEQQ